MKVLVIDDDRNMNEFISRVLQNKLKCRVVSVYNGVDVFVNLQKQDFDFIVLDISLPLLHGVEILEIIRSDPRYKNLPVVMMTANREKEIITKLIDLGITDYLAKPLTLEFTHQKFKAVIEKISQLEITNEEGEPGLNNSLLCIEPNKELSAEINKIKEFDEIIITDSGADAIKLFIQKRPVAVYIGQNIPVVNDKVLIKTLRQLDPDNKVNIIVKKEEDKLTEEEKSFVNFSIVFNSNIEDFCSDLIKKAKS